MTRRRFSPRLCRACGRVFLPTSALQRYGSAFCKSRGPVWRDKTGYAGPWAVLGREVDHDAA